jgi:hypothetical protein
MHFGPHLKPHFTPQERPDFRDGLDDICQILCETGQELSEKAEAILLTYEKRYTPAVFTSHIAV